MKQLTSNELAFALENASRAVRVGGTYVHYKSAEKPYKVLNVALLEKEEEPCVVYQALYGEKLIWVRALSKFLESVDHEGKKVTRFREI